MVNKIKVMTLILVSAIVIIFLYNAYVLFAIYSNGLVEFQSDAISIFGSIIQGMSALLSVAIAVIIFRVQSLENRNFSLEQSTLNYIHNITKFTYPKWIPSVEEDIKNGIITKRYFERRFDALNRRRGLKTPHKEMLKELEIDRDEQQKRLEETLNNHIEISQTIKRTRDGIISSVILLISPIIISFLMLMVSDALTPLGNFGFVVIVVLLSAIGIVILIQTVLDSTVQDN